MAPPKGHRYAAGCLTSGSPRKYDREKIAKDLIAWARKESSVNLCDFCSSREPPLDPRKLSHWAITDNKFSESFNAAKAFLGARRERLVNEGKFHTRTYEMNATTYDHFMKNEKRSQSVFESILKKKENDKKESQVVINVTDYSKVGPIDQTPS